MTSDVEMVKIQMNDERHLPSFNVKSNTVTIIRISDIHIEMESWLSDHEATIIGYYNGYSFCPIYEVTDEIMILFALRWS